MDIIREAESHADEDKRKKEEIEARNRADSLVYQTEKMLQEHRSKLSETDARAVEAAIADTKKALEEGGVDRINRAAEALTQASHKVAEAMYKTAGPGGQAGGGAAPDGAAGGAPKQDDVIDAEYVDADDKKKD